MLCCDERFNLVGPDGFAPNLHDLCKENLVSSHRVQHIGSKMARAAFGPLGKAPIAWNSTRLSDIETSYTMSFFIMQKALLVPTGSPNGRKLESIRYKERHNEFGKTTFTLGIDEHVLLTSCRVSLLEGRRQYHLNRKLKRSV